MYVAFCKLIFKANKYLNAHPSGCVFCFRVLLLSHPTGCVFCFELLSNFYKLNVNDWQKSSIARIAIAKKLKKHI